MDGPTKIFLDTILSNYSREVPPWDGNGQPVIMNISVPFIVLGDLVNKDTFFIIYCFR